MYNASGDAATVALTNRVMRIEAELLVLYCIVPVKQENSVSWLSSPSLQLTRVRRAVERQG